ncbi:MAG: retroviral-like aspartic protease family protein [Candidatus Cloacimonetes bacterium]|nr:retroviral-like aspartic protease family protein [Candidatus Cloacimonadota bacterium]
MILKKVSAQMSIKAFIICFCLINFISTVNAQINDQNIRTQVIKEKRTDEKITIPMDLSMMVPSIEIFINDKGPYRFDFDTGAGGSTISEKLAADLELKIIGKAEVGSPAGDKRIAVDVVRVPKLTISNLLFEEIEMTVMDFGDMLQVDGILSIDHFSDYLITFDYPAKNIQFEKGLLQKSGENVIPFGPAMQIEINIDGTKTNAHLDTGCPVSFAFPLSMQDELSFKTPPVESGTARMIGTSFKIWKAQLDGDIHLANIIFESPEIVLEDRPGNFITIGYQTLRNLILTIDQKNSLFKFEEKIIRNNSIPVITDEDNKFSGCYGDVRNVTFENGNLYVQRDGGMKLKLDEVEDNLYEARLPKGLKAMNKLPKIRFKMDDHDKVTGLIFVHEDGREEFVLKTIN